jgi:hypothetical protein
LIPVRSTAASQELICSCCLASSWCTYPYYMKQQSWIG